MSNDMPTREEILVAINTVVTQIAKDETVLSNLPDAVLQEFGAKVGELGLYFGLAKFGVMAAQRKEQAKPN